MTIETVDLDGPRFGEVLVEIKATGICHTDYYTLSGADPEGIFPVILGHEGKERVAANACTGGHRAQLRELSKMVNAEVRASRELVNSCR